MSCAEIRAARVLMLHQFPESRRALGVGERRVTKALMIPSEFVLLTKSYSVFMSLEVLSVLRADNVLSFMLLGLFAVLIFKRVLRKSQKQLSR